MARQLACVLSAQTYEPDCTMQQQPRASVPDSAQAAVVAEAIAATSSTAAARAVAERPNEAMWGARMGSAIASVRSRLAHSRQRLDPERGWAPSELRQHRLGARHVETARRLDQQLGD